MITLSVNNTFVSSLSILTPLTYFSDSTSFSGTSMMVLSSECAPLVLVPDLEGKAFRIYYRKGRCLLKIFGRHC